MDYHCHVHQPYLSDIVKAKEIIWSQGMNIIQRPGHNQCIGILHASNHELPKECDYLLTLLATGRLDQNPHKNHVKIEES